LGKLAADANWVLVFGSAKQLKNDHHIEEIRKVYPKALISGCSTAGEIFDVTVLDDSLSVTVIHFEHIHLQATHSRISGPKGSFRCDKELVQAIPHEGLRHVFVLSGELNINGSELVTGLTEKPPSDVTITGGLSGDAGRFEETLVLWQDQVQGSTSASVRWEVGILSGLNASSQALMVMYSMEWMANLLWSYINHT